MIEGADLRPRTLIGRPGRNEPVREDPLDEAGDALQVPPDRVQPGLSEDGEHQPHARRVDRLAAAPGRDLALAREQHGFGRLQRAQRPDRHRHLPALRLCIGVAQRETILPQVDALLTQVREANGAPMTDDVLMLAVSPGWATEPTAALS